MTSQPSPTYNFPGISYNPSYFKTSSSGLTTGAANALYLRKTYADTATSLETFNAGINTTTLSASGLVEANAGITVIGTSTLSSLKVTTNKINNKNANGDITIGDEQIGAVGGIYIGTTAARTAAIEIGTGAAAITIGESGSVLIGTCGLKTPNVNSTSNGTDLSIADTQTTGDLNIGTNVGRTSAGAINIGTGSTNVNPINIGSSTSDTTINGILQSTGQATFDLAPHCVVVPTFSEDLANKLYVDSRIASGGSNFLYFNYSVDSDISPLVKKLGNSIVIATLQTVSTTQLNTNSIAKFISDVGVPNITTIPSGIWELNQWGNAVGGHAGTLFYFFKLFTYRPSTLTYTLRGQSGNSKVIDLTTPSLYFATLSLGSFSVLLEDRIVIEVFSIGTGTGGVNTLNSYYQGNNYSYLTCPIIEGTDLLNKNNTWTGTNTFSADLTAKTLLITGTASTATLNPIVATYSLDIGSTQTSGDINIGVSSGRLDGGNINIGTGSGSTAIPIAIGGSGSVTTIKGTTLTSSIDVAAAGTMSIGNTTATTLNIGVTAGAAVNIGKTGGLTTVNSALKSTGLITADGGLTMGGSNDITLGSGAPAPLKTQLGYLLSKGLVTSTSIPNAGVGSVYTYAPSTGTTAYKLDGGTYMASLYGLVSMTTVPNTTTINFQYGIQYTSSTTPLTPTTLTNATYMDMTIAYAPNDENIIPHSSTFMFTVPSGNTNYYYAYGYIGLGSSSGGSFTVGVQLMGLARIA